jgi:large subunit ribosomal protein L13
MSTYSAKPLEMEQNRKWIVLDATNQSMGRLAVEAAKILRGKNKPEFTPHVDCGDHVIIINAAKIMLTGIRCIPAVFAASRAGARSKKTRSSP